MHLEPCPVCKGKPKLEHTDDLGLRENDRYYRFSCCGIKGAPHPNDTVGAGKQWNDAVAAYNRRDGGIGMSNKKRFFNAGQKLEVEG